MLLVRILLAVVSLITGIFAVAAGCIECSYICAPSENTPSRRKKAKIAYWVFFAITCLTGCFFELWALAEVILNHSVIDLIIAVIYPVLLYKLES